VQFFASKLHIGSFICIDFFSFCKVVYIPSCEMELILE
jgi:hypothetical protein